MAPHVILHSFAYAIDYLSEQVADLSPADLVAQPKGLRNHPAWIIGHITQATQELSEALGLSPWLPADWAARFGTGSVPTADVTIYGARDGLIAALRDAQRRISRRIEGLTDAQLDAPFPVEAYREVFPTLRHALVQVLVGHTSFHVGQVSVWRRAMGLPAMKRGFE